MGTIAETVETVPPVQHQPPCAPNIDTNEHCVSLVYFAPEIKQTDFYTNNAYKNKSITVDKAFSVLLISMLLFHECIEQRI